MKKLFLCFAAGLSLLSGAVASRAAEKIDVSKLPAPSDKKGLTYAKDIQPIFERSCFKCHGSEKQKGKLRLDSREAALKGGENGEAIKAGKSAESPLVHFIGYLVEDSEMPPKKKDGTSQQLPKEDIALIRAWIDQGAK